jgi:hypothetical protein
MSALWAEYGTLLIGVGVALALLLAGFGWLLAAGGARGSERQSELFRRQQLRRLEERYPR